MTRNLEAIKEKLGNLYEKNNKQEKNCHKTINRKKIVSHMMESSFY